MRDVAISVLVLLIACAANAQSFTPLGDLAGGLVSSEAWAISVDGGTIVGSSESASGAEAFRWTQAEGMVALGDLPSGAFGSAAWGVASGGSAIAGTGTSTIGEEAFRWTPSSGLVGLGFLGGRLASLALGVSDDGGTVVGYGSGPDVEAFRWQAAGGMQGLGFLSSGSFSIATAVDADGGVVVGADMDAVFEAFRWTPGGGMVGLGFPPGNVESAAVAVSADGAVVVGTGYETFNITDGAQAFRWTSSTGITGLGTPDGFMGSRAQDVSSDATHVVGFVADPASARHAALWDEGNGWRLLKETLELGCALDLTGWHLEVASGIAKQAGVLRIVGHGTNPDGDREAFLAELPEAGCASPRVPALPGVAVVLAGLLVAASGIARSAEWRRAAASCGAKGR